MPLPESESEDLQVTTFDEEESADLRRHFVRQATRLTLAFALLFGAVFFTFWWSGSAVRFGAARVADRAETTWRVTGTVRDGVTHRPIPWASIADDPAGQPPFYRTDADQSGVFELKTLPEPHRIRVTAPGYKSVMVRIGRAWFLWLPKGAEELDIAMFPD